MQDIQVHYTAVYHLNLLGTECGEIVNVRAQVESVTLDRKRWLNWELGEFKYFSGNTENMTSQLCLYTLI